MIDAWRRLSWGALGLALAASAQAADIKDIRAKYATLANTCKSCHDSFRAPQR